MSDHNKDFVNLYKTDPFVAMVAQMRAEAWVSGYRAARRDAEAVVTDNGMIHPENPHYEVVAAMRQHEGSSMYRRAFEDLTQTATRAEANHVLTLAALARMVEGEGA